LSCTALMFSSSTLRSLVSKSSFWAFAGYVCSRRTWASTTSKTCECEGKGCRQMLGCDHRRPCPTIIDIIEIRFPLSYCVPMCSPITEIRVRHSLSHGKSKPLLIAFFRKATDGYRKHVKTCEHSINDTSYRQTNNLG
jgi:hypothetical protein